MVIGSVTYRCELATQGHAPRTGSPEIAAWFWSNIFDFLDPPY